MHINIVHTIGILLIIALAWGAIQYMTLPPPVKMIVIVLMFVLAILWVAETFGLFPGGSITVGLTQFRAMLA